MFLLLEIFLETFVIVIVNLGRLSEIFILRVKPTKMNYEILYQLIRKRCQFSEIFISFSENGFQLEILETLKEH